MRFKLDNNKTQWDVNFTISMGYETYKNAAQRDTNNLEEHLSIATTPPHIVIMRR
jgi:hypothetical protein